MSAPISVTPAPTRRLIVDAGKSKPLKRGGLNLASLEKMKAGFERAHKARFGFIDRKKSW